MSVFSKISSANQAQYYASKEGGQCLFSSTTDVVSIPVTGGPVAFFQNPKNSGVMLHFYRLMCTNRYMGRWSRLINGTVALLPLAQSRPNFNRSGGTMQSKANLYAGDKFTVLGGTTAKTIYVKDYDTQHIDEEGTIILPPDSSRIWTFSPDVAKTGGGAAIEIIWWELPI